MLMKRLFPIVLVLSVAAWPATGPKAAEDPAAAQPVEQAEPIITTEQTIDARVGEKKVIDADARIIDLTLTRPEVVDAFVTAERQLTLTPNSPGVGNVIAYLENDKRISYRVRVFVADPEAFAQRLRERIGHIQNVDIEVLKGKILVDGRVLYLKDMDEIERAVGDNPSIINLTSLTSRNARILAREIERELRESAIYGASVEVRDNRVTLVGTLRSERLVKKAEKIASSITPNFDSLLKVAPAAAPTQGRAD